MAIKGSLREASISLRIPMIFNLILCPEMAAAAAERGRKAAAAAAAAAVLQAAAAPKL
jgi:hypothetical protein